MTASSTKLKITYGTEDTSDGSKTLNNMNPEATSENLVATANKFAALQKRVVREVARIDTTIISG